MLWYLLFCLGLRSSSASPRFTANHAVRRTFYRHGKTTSQHWLITMLVSVAIAMGCSYPSVFLSNSSDAGLAAHPRHFRTTAGQSRGDSTHVDVELRQVWIHGSFLKALDKEVLRFALDIQRELLGTEISKADYSFPHAILKDDAGSWAYHSPLMYWNNSARTIKHDDDIVGSINSQAKGHGWPVGVSLPHESVFAGRQFKHGKLIAADALIITMMVHPNNRMGRTWHDGAMSLPMGLCKDCALFPPNGDVSASRTYDVVGSKSTTVRDNLLLGAAYAFMAVYVLLSLKRMRAFHSRFGLVVTAITQMTCSILSSFTVCSLLRINLMTIPQNAYPFVVLAIGLENMFRIINAILAYPATMATELRIANALGDVGPVSMATAAQNVLILSVLSRVVSPGVAAFCAFACIATLFDNFFLLTFFVAVLKVDIRRFELQDSLVRANQSKRLKRKGATDHTWLDALLHGKLPFSTRIAGTVVMTTFILSLNYHFFDRTGVTAGLQPSSSALNEGPLNTTTVNAVVPLSSTSSVTPDQWVQMLDLDTAREVATMANPGVENFVVRLFSPLVVVLPGANRTNADLEAAWTTTVRNFTRHNFYPVAVAVGFIVAFVAVLMNFLLYSESADDAVIYGEEENALTVRALRLPHRLDIIKLASNGQGDFVSVSLDKTIVIALFDKAHQVHRIRSLSKDALATIHWPVYQVEIDDSGQWIACHCADEQVRIFLCASSPAFVFSARLRYPDDNPPVLFEFLRLDNSTRGSRTQFMVVTSGGRMAMSRIEEGKAKMASITTGSLVGASLQKAPDLPPRLIVVTDQAQVLSFSCHEGHWNQIASQSLLADASVNGRLTEAVQIEHHEHPRANSLVVLTQKDVVFLDSESLKVYTRIRARRDDYLYVNLLLGSPMTCPSCKSAAYPCAAVVSEHKEGSRRDNERTLIVYRPQDEDEEAAICLRPGSPLCRSFSDTPASTQCLPNLGAWHTVTHQAVLGLRRKPATNDTTEPRHAQHADQPEGALGLRHRRAKQATSHPHETMDDGWEAYRFGLDGRIETIDAPGSGFIVDDEPSALPVALSVTEPGPAVALDAHSVVVAFGNVVRIVRSTGRCPTLDRRASGS